jgi:hypothetical protein
VCVCVFWSESVEREREGRRENSECNNVLMTQRESGRNECMYVCM